MNEQPTNEQIVMQMVQTFLQRTNLKGGEVDNYAKCFNFLQTIVEGQNVIVPAELFNKGMDAIQTLNDHEEEERKDIPVLEDTSNGDEMQSEGGPVELEAVE